MPLALLYLYQIIIAQHLSQKNLNLRSRSIIYSLLFLMMGLLTGCDGTLPTISDEQQNNITNNEQWVENTKPTPTAESTTQQKENDLWQRIRDDYQLTQTIPPVGQKRIDDILERYSKHPHDILQQTEQARLYLHYIVTEFEKNNMPSELALLPFVESRYDPFAYSSGRASGLWQFIPGTARRFNMQESWWHDERRDVIKSTQAAIDYFQYLHDFFDDDWLLAIAAYNAGEGTVRKAIRRNQKAGKPTDYWSLPLPKQTQFYIPKLLAWAQLINKPEDYNIVLAPVENSPTFTTVDIGSQIDLATLSKISNVDIKNIYALNPAYNRWATDPKAPHNLLLPIDKAETTVASLASYPVENRMQWQRYTVKPNDALSLIAKRFKTDSASIKKANKLKGSTIRVGQTLVIPKASQDSHFYISSANQRLTHRQNANTRKDHTKVDYIAQTGDTLWSIAKAHNVTPDSIAYWNNMSVRDVLKNQQKLVIWVKNNSPKSTASNTQTTNWTQASADISPIKRKVIYQVRSGDNLSSIAKRFAVNVSDIRNWNNIEQKKYLQPGQSLRLFVTVVDRNI